mmetsp:Transcript_17337/g.35206  ORF Transcript_17337/g.35206 Transcript_17337/m.35206 type:complete len:468 (-) Transcript_17337:774-2177(-)
MWVCGCVYVGACVSVCPSLRSSFILLRTHLCRLLLLQQGGRSVFFLLSLCRLIPPFSTPPFSCRRRRRKGRGGSRLRGIRHCRILLQIVFLVLIAFLPFLFLLHDYVFHRVPILRFLSIIPGRLRGETSGARIHCRSAWAVSFHVADPLEGAVEGFFDHFLLHTLPLVIPREIMLKEVLCVLLLFRLCLLSLSLRLQVRQACTQNPPHHAPVGSSDLQGGIGTGRSLRISQSSGSVQRLENERLVCLRYFPQLSLLLSFSLRCSPSVIPLPVLLINTPPLQLSPCLPEKTVRRLGVRGTFPPRHPHRSRSSHSHGPLEGRLLLLLGDWGLLVRVEGRAPHGSGSRSGSGWRTRTTPEYPRQPTVTPDTNLRRCCRSVLLLLSRSCLDCLRFRPFLLSEHLHVLFRVGSLPGFISLPPLLKLRLVVSESARSPVPALPTPLDVSTHDRLRVVGKFGVESRLATWGSYR